MEIHEPLISRLKESAKEMDNFRKKLIDNGDVVKYYHEVMQLAGCAGRIEAVIEISEKKQ
jgi:hypothetical protein